MGSEHYPLVPTLGPLEQPISRVARQRPEGIKGSPSGSWRPSTWAEQSGRLTTVNGFDTILESERSPKTGGPTAARPRASERKSHDLPMAAYLGSWHAEIPTCSVQGETQHHLSTYHECHMCEGDM